MKLTPACDFNIWGLDKIQTSEVRVHLDTFDGCCVRLHKSIYPLLHLSAIQTIKRRKRREDIK
jgi:hypothetical protein